MGSKKQFFFWVGSHSAFAPGERQRTAGSGTCPENGCEEYTCGFIPGQWYDESAAINYYYEAYISSRRMIPIIDTISNLQIGNVFDITEFKNRMLNFEPMLSMWRRAPSSQTAKSTVSLPKAVPGETRVRKPSVDLRRARPRHAPLLTPINTILPQGCPGTASGKETASFTLPSPEDNHHKTVLGQTRVRLATFSRCRRLSGCSDTCLFYPGMSCGCQTIELVLLPQTTQTITRLETIVLWHWTLQLHVGASAKCPQTRRAGQLGCD